MIATVPHLTTALQGPLQELEKKILQEQLRIEAWLREQWLLTPPPFYCSVDLRNAGYKVSAVDTNLFPAGFNNLNSDFMPLAIHAVQSTLERICPRAKKLLLIPENHTRNLFYFEHLAALTEILTNAGFEVRIGSLLDQIKSPKAITLNSGKTITLYPIEKIDQRIVSGEFDPCAIILNNDLSEGAPEILQNIEQVILPPLELGWQNRLKSSHFQHYQNVSNELGQLLQLDPWLISPLFRFCGEVDFMTSEGENCLLKHSTALFTAIEQKYAQYGVKEKPFVVIKADAGTYGMAVMMIQDPDEIRHLNRKQREQMAKGKGGQNVTKAIVQEGVYTSERVENAVAEPVVYMIGQHVIGGFYRVHSGKSETDNLNSPGANFKPLAFADCCTYPCAPGTKKADNRFYLYGVIARLALLAAAREKAEVCQK